jgi:hypothetical protein
MAPVAFDPAPRRYIVPVGVAKAPRDKIETQGNGKIDREVTP